MLVQERANPVFFHRGKARYNGVDALWITMV